MSHSEQGPGRAATRGALGFCCLVLAELATGVGLWISSGFDYAMAVDCYLVTDLVLALVFAFCGFWVAWRRPRNPIGWLLLGGGAAHGTTVALVGLLSVGVQQHWADPVLSVIVTIATVCWPLGVRLFLPLALLLFPSGRLPSPRWRPVGWLIVGIMLLFEAWSLLTPAPYAIGGPPPFFSMFSVPALEPLRPQLDLAAIVVPMLIDVAALVVRYRSGDELLRRQMLWLMLAVLFAVPWAPLGVSSVVLQILIILQPGAIAVAILRPKLLDIRLVVSRTLLYLLLSVGVIGLYTGVVLLFDRALRYTLGIARDALIAVAVAIAFHPARAWLQRITDRLLYGDRRDPVRVLSQLGARMSEEAGSLDDLLTAVREALRLPYTAFRVGGAEVASSGHATIQREVVPLAWPDAGDAELVIGVRHGQTRLDTEDLRVLAVLVVPLTVALRATMLSRALQVSRERLVSAREEERRRLRRDLHDELGPTLSALAFTADAAHNLVRSEPEAAAALLKNIREHVSAALTEIRRLVEGLRPPALDELGLVGALRQHAERLSYRDGGDPLRVVIDAPAGRLEISAAVEVAAYRIITEALTNAARHSWASEARVRIAVDNALLIEVTDNGGGSADSWPHGMGTATMAERAAELAGWCRSGPGPDGGEVRASLPLR